MKPAVPGLEVLPTLYYPKDRPLNVSLTRFFSNVLRYSYCSSLTGEGPVLIIFAEGAGAVFGL